MRAARRLGAGRTPAGTGLFGYGDAARSTPILTGLRRNPGPTLATTGTLDHAGNAVRHRAGPPGHRRDTSALLTRNDRRNHGSGPYRPPVTGPGTARTGNIRGSGEAAGLRFVGIDSLVGVPAAAGLAARDAVTGLPVGASTVAVAARPAVLTGVGLASATDDTVRAGVAAGLDESVSAGVTAGLDEPVRAGVTPGLDEPVRASITAGLDESVRAGVTPGLDEPVRASITAGLDESVRAGVRTRLNERMGTGVGPRPAVGGTVTVGPLVAGNRRRGLSRTTAGIAVRSGVAGLSAPARTPTGGSLASGEVLGPSPADPVPAGAILARTGPSRRRGRPVGRGGTLFVPVRNGAGLMHGVIGVRDRPRLVHGVIAVRDRA
ncbi:hypothetical protein QLQ12_33890 [Actinoplanes sp. NEAU-A12]|uniref:Uncharacterized protein n=1 Tax=Actinoplanes sandaracinus TaxID=3045177 RepID=A0ABT6WV42_9ACTN|nr:hypothetical protein [Actinoplanes sandaracinus]MDI6103616.1 hypothetical protein [Actinoplanes sandaracinus]